jgi:hypothetical protein
MQILKVMARAYSPPERLGAMIEFDEHLIAERCNLHFPLPALGVEIATVGSMHLLAGLEDKLKPFKLALVTFWVDSVASAQEALNRSGAETLLEPERGPGGSFMIVKHPDGLVVEYVDQTA